MSAAFPNARPEFISLVSAEGGRLGAALGLRYCSRHRTLARFTRVLSFDSLLAIRYNDSRTLLEFIRLLERHARDSGCVTLSIRSFASRDASAELETLKFSVSKRPEFELRLDKSEGELWKGIEHKRRKNINKAVRMGISIHDLPVLQGISELRRLQRETSDRILARSVPRIHPSNLNDDPI